MSISVLAPPPTDRVPIAIHARASCRTRLGYLRGSARARGHIRLGVRALARALLPKRSSERALARVVRRAVRHRRAEQLVLPSALAPAVRTMAARRPGRLSVRGEAQPLHHPYQAPQHRCADRGALI